MPSAVYAPDSDGTSRAAGRVAVVTGAGSAEGAAVAVRLADLGLAVALLDTAAGACADVASRITDGGGRAVALVADVADPAALASVSAGLAAPWDAPDVLVNTVSATVRGPLCALSDEQWAAATGHPLRGVFVASRQLVDPMIEAGRGRIVTVAPPLADGSEHSVLRAGLEGFTRTVALELAAFGVTANLIAPRRPQAGMHSDRAPDGPPAGAGRYPQAVADAVGVLLDAAAAAVSGQTVYVDADDPL